MPVGTGLLCSVAAFLLADVCGAWSWAVVILLMFGSAFL